MIPVLIFCIMKTLLTGASGLLGRALTKQLSRRSDVELTATAFSRARPPMVVADITKPEEVEALFARARPDIVIHAAAERRPDVVDASPAQARTLNVAATETIARACAKYNAFLIYISTDYVYDGTNPPYFPDSPLNPLNEYGTLKLEGEHAVRAALGGASCAAGASASTGAVAAGAAGGAAPAAIIRIPLLYGPVERLEECSVTELALKLKTGAPCSVEHWATRYPLHVDDVADAIIRIADARIAAPERLAAARANGGLPIFLLSGPQGLTKYEMLAKMAAALGIDASFVRPDPNPPAGAPRPKDCRMDTSLIESLGYRPRVDFVDGIRGALLPFFTNSSNEKQA